MKKNVRKKTLLFFILIIICNLYIAFSFYENSQRVKLSERWIRHTEDVINTSAEILMMVKDLQITSEEFYFSRRNNEVSAFSPDKNILQNVKRLKAMIIDNPPQIVLADSLKFSVTRYLSFLQTAGTIIEKKFDVAEAYDVARVGKQYASQIASLLNTIKAAESRLFKERTRIHTLSVARFNQSIVLMFSLFGLFTIILFIAAGNYFFQNRETGRRRRELLLLNAKLAEETDQRKNHAAALQVVNDELIYQNGEKEKRAGELSIANTELAFQNKEKERRAAELIIANAELIFQNNEKESRAGELVIANNELAFQNNEKGKRAAELIIANQELAFQNNEKEKRAAELIVANTELAFQNEVKEKMSADLIQRSKNLEQFSYIVSHNLRAPVANILGISNVLRNDVVEQDRPRIQGFLFTAVEQLDDIVKDLNKILQVRSEITEHKEPVYFNSLVKHIKSSIENLILKENVQIETDFTAANKIMTLKSYIHSIFYNLISNSIKYRQPGKAPQILIKSEVINGKVRLTFVDKGIGIDMELHKDKVFGLYKRFHLNVEGKGLGLYMVKTQVEILEGTIEVESKPNVGTKFIIDLPMQLA